MGRKRTRDFDLPPRLYRRGASYYYVGADGKWLALGSDKGRAIRKWADLEYVTETRTVATLIDRYLADCIGNLQPSTQKQYRSCGKMIKEQWGDLPCDGLRTSQIAQYRDRTKAKVNTNTLISLLRKAYQRAVEWEWSPTNPAAAVRFNEDHRRERYLNDAEYTAIRAAAPSWLATAMDVSYLTALRPCDVLSLRWDQVGERVNILPRKTQKTRVSISFEMTPELRAILDQARARTIVGLYVVATDKGRPVSIRRLQNTWAAIVRGLGITDCQFRDIRAKSATDADAQGEDAQSLLHHTSASMTARYLKLGQTKRATPLRRVL